MKSKATVLITFLLLLTAFSQPYIEWQKSLGGIDNDSAFYTQQTSDGGYIIGGSSASNDGDVSGNHGDFDYWVVKLSDLLTVDNNEMTRNMFLYPNPNTGLFF